MRTVIGALLVVGLATLTAGPIGAQGKSTERLGTVRFVTSCAPAVQPQFDRAVALLHSFGSTPRWAPSPRWRRRPRLRDGPLGRGDGLAGQPAGRPPDRARPQGGLGRGREGEGGGRQDRRASRTTSRPSRSSTRTRTRWTTGPVRWPTSGDGGSSPRGIPTDSRGGDLLRARAQHHARPTDKTYANQLKAAGDPREGLRRAAGPSRRGPLPDPQLRLPAHRGQGPARRAALREASRPAAPHALHMPSHIFTRVGDWQESIETNRASAKAAADELRRRGSQTGAPLLRRACTPRTT